MTVAFAYDGSPRTGTTWSGEVAGSVSGSYDNDFRAIEQRVNGTDPIAFDYDRDGLLVEAGGLVLDRDPANGLLTGTSLGQVTTHRDFDVFGALATETVAFAGTEIYRAAYTRDAMSRIEEKTETIGGVTTTWGYEYDTSARLVAVTQGGVSFSSYTYDGNGNRLSYDGPFGAATATYDAQDRLLAYGDTSYSYTGAGELASKSQGSATVEYDYDALGSLRGVTLSTGLGIDYVVDGQTRRVGKKIGGTLVGGFLYWDQLEPVAELDGTGAVVARFVYGSRLHVPDYLVKGGATYRIVADHLGSVRLVVNTATGQIAQRLDYDAFGRITLDTNPGFQPFGFAGGLYDAQTGIVRFGARDYDPEVGRWTAKDPIGFSGGISNLYSYINSDAVNFIDPTGLGGCTVDFPGFPITLPRTDIRIPLNHAGVVAYNDLGSTRYYEYGRYGGDFGKVEREIIPDLQRGLDGDFTDESWQRLRDALRDGPGKGHRPFLSCDDDADFGQIVEFAENRMNDPNREPYSWNPFKQNTCVTFAVEAMEAGRK